MLDWFNCLLEFGSFLLIFFCISDKSIYKLQNYLLYFFLGGLSSIYFTQTKHQILLLNITIYIFILIITFRKISLKHRIILSICSIPFMLLMEFILHSLLPVSSLQTDIGNLITNIIMLLVLWIILIQIRKNDLSYWISSFFQKHFIIILLFSFTLIVLGQVYLSRLSTLWSYLPGTITLLIFAAFLIIVSIYIRYQRSTDRFRASILEKQIMESESFVQSMRTQLHDYKHHIQYLLDQIQSAPDLSSLQTETAEYLIDLDHDRSLYDQLIAIHEPVFRATLFGCFARCKKLNISFELIMSDLLPTFPLKDYQLVEVIENLITNAIEHNLTLSVENRFILITMTTDNDLQYFSIENPAENLELPLSALYRVGTTTKNGHAGLGLDSINQILSANNISFSGSHDLDMKSIRFELTYER